MIVVGLVIHEPRDAPRTVAPAQPRPVTHSRQGFYAVLGKSTVRGQVLMVFVNDGASRDRLLVAVQVVGADDAGVPGAKVAHVPIIARLPVDPLHLEEAGADGAAVIDPVDRC